MIDRGSRIFWSLGRSARAWATLPAFVHRPCSPWTTDVQFPLLVKHKNVPIASVRARGEHALL